MMKAYWRVTLQLVVVFGISQSFVINPTRNGRINCDRNANHNYQHHEHFGSARDDFGDGDENGAADWSRLAARTDVRIFLTQRAVQSFVFLLKSCGDPHTVRWLEVRRRQACLSLPTIRILIICFLTLSFAIPVEL